MNRRQKTRKGKHRAQHTKATRTPDRPRIVFAGSKLPRVDNAHIVPRMYQRAWEGRERQVAVHRVGKDGHELRSTKRAGTRGPYYRRTRPQGMDTDDFEASLADIEGRATSPLRELIAGQPITVERKGAVAQLLATQMMRCPAFFETHEQLMEETLEEMSPKNFRPRYLASVDGDLERAREGMRSAYGNKTNSLTSMLSYSMKVASVLAQMRWHVLRIADPLFAYSDQPVVLWPMSVETTRPFARPHLGPLTMLEIRVSIAPDVAILMSWVDLSDVAGLVMKAQVAAELNAFTVSQDGSRSPPRPLRGRHRRATPRYPSLCPRSRRRSCGLPAPGDRHPA
jgi:Protein of unknown function (DUF4238)